eukprot:TRINITY_DN22914_c0_g1_i1.p1 TRINITY_DN22914_c0_g1~~TRINITY_DN22914_c0_g1_i1.p1  ORF type:complete len:291 (-),score=21.79 TRINITY_DN22914_c0_g1_i1:650-1432(-)
MHSRPCLAGDGLECAICWEPFDADNNCPYALWCGHTLCKTCISGLPWAIFSQIPQLTFQLPCVISCPWCTWLTPRVTIRGNLKYPCKNFSLVWLLDAVKQQEINQNSSDCHQRSPVSPSRSKGSTSGTSSCSTRHNPPEEIASSPRNTFVLDNSANNRNAVPGPQNLEGSEVGDGGQSGIDLLILWSFSVLFGAVMFTLRLCRKLPFVFMLLFLVFCVLPCSGLITAMHFFLSLFFAIPSSAITVLSLYYVELLVFRILD